MLWKTLVVGATLVLVAACTEDATPGAIQDADACASAVSQVAEATDGQAAAEDLAPAFEACASVEDFSQFAEQDLADVMGDMDAQEFVSEQCAATEELADTQLCESL